MSEGLALFIHTYKGISREGAGGAKKSFCLSLRHQRLRARRISLLLLHARAIWRTFCYNNRDKFSVFSFQFLAID
jgi:hypothetical protein